MGEAVGAVVGAGVTWGVGLGPVEAVGAADCDGGTGEAVVSAVGVGAGVVGAAVGE
jgi:hypothetical protein